MKGSFSHLSILIHAPSFCIIHKQDIIEKPNDSAVIADVCWSPNSKYFAVALNHVLPSNKSESIPNKYYINKVLVVNIHNPTDKTVIQTTSHSIKNICWSTDGITLIIQTYDELLAVNTTTRESFPIPQNRPSSSNLVYSENHIYYGTSLGQVSRVDLRTGMWFMSLAKNMASIDNLILTQDDYLIFTCIQQKNIFIGKLNNQRLTRILQSHTYPIVGMALSNENILASIAIDGTLILWDLETYKPLFRLLRANTHNAVTDIAFHPLKNDLLAIIDINNKLQIIKINYNEIRKSSASIQSIYYTTAKIALVGDSGVGKSGLGYRIAEQQFKLTESTHGQQFWVINELGITRQDGAIGEAILWDFAGQPNFRPIHSLFLEDIDIALILFDPSRYDTFSGVDYWLSQLALQDRSCKSILVAARMDVSQLSHTQDELDKFCKDHGITGGFIKVSAKTGQGIDELMELLQEQIDWDLKPATVTTETFKRIKDFVLSLKADAERTDVIVSPSMLREQLEASDKRWTFSDAELTTAVGHLANHGYVTILRHSSSEEFILLKPELLVDLASQVIFRAQENEKGLGSLNEVKILRNEYLFASLEPLASTEQELLLNAAIELFLNRNICFRESADGQTFLIFPSLIRDLPPPMTEDTQLIEDMSYVVTGVTENIYAALVVLLGYSSTFQRTNQWRRQAEYKTVKGQYACVFKQVNDDTTELQLVLYYDKNIPEYARDRFKGLFEEILYSRDVTVNRFPPIFCPECSYQQQRTEVMRRMNEKRNFIVCADCGKRINLPEISARVRLNQEDRSEVLKEQIFTQMKTTYETALVSVKGFFRETKAKSPSCFISYAWGNSIHQQWVYNFASDLENAGLNIVLDRWDLTPGTDLPRFMSQIEDIKTINFVLPIGTPLYREKYENVRPETGSSVAFEVNHINTRLLRGTELERNSIIPLLLDGNERESLPPSMRNLIFIDFRSQSHYFVGLFELILTLYKIPFRDSAVADLYDRLQSEAENYANMK